MPRVLGPDEDAASAEFRPLTMHSEQDMDILPGAVGGSMEVIKADGPAVARSPMTDRSLEAEWSVFINTHLTLKSVDTSKQTFSVSGYVNALWRCPDLEQEKIRTDYYARDHVETTIKNGLAQASNHSDYRCCIDREYVQKEIRWAKKYKKKIIIVYEKDRDRTGFFDYAEAWNKYRGSEWEFLLQIDATEYSRDYLHQDAMLRAIFAKAEACTPRGTEATLRQVVTAPAALGKQYGSAADAAALNRPGHWNFFLSHNQAHGGDQANALHLRFKEHGYTSWYDHAMLDKSEAAMEEGVKNSDYFVLVLTGAAGDDRRGRPGSSQGYIHTSQGRSYVDGFKLSFDHWYSTPFNPHRMFDNALVEKSHTKECSFYYYPTGHGNEGKPYGGLVKMAVQFEATLSQHINMEDFPFDRQILRLAFFVRREWTVLSTPPAWANTGHASDEKLCTTTVSQAVVHYELKKPWVSTARPDAKPGSGYIVDVRVQRKYEYELRKIVLPLFVLVLIASSSLGLEPESTNDRVIVPAVMTLAISGFFQVIQGVVPNQPTMTKLDKYTIFCWLCIVSVVLETLAVKVVLEQTRFMPFAGNATGEDSAHNDSPCNSPQRAQWCPKMGEIDRASSAYHVAESMDTWAIYGVLLFW